MAAGKKTDLEALYQAIDEEIERIDAGGDALEETEPIDGPIVFKKPLDIVIRLRLSGEQFEQVARIAGAKGIGPAALLHEWALERLKKEAIKH